MKHFALCFLSLLLVSITSTQAFSSSKKYHITYEIQKQNCTDTISCYYSNTCCFHTMSKHGSSYFKLLVDFKEEIIKTYSSYYSSERNELVSHKSENSFSDYEKNLKRRSEYDYLYPDDELNQEIKSIKHKDTKKILGRKCYHLEVWHGDIKSDRINKYSGFDIVPGIILELSINNKITRRAIHIDNNWFESCN